MCDHVLQRRPIVRSHSLTAPAWPASTTSTRKRSSVSSSLTPTPAKQVHNSTTSKHDNTVLVFLRQGPGLAWPGSGFLDSNSSRIGECAPNLWPRNIVKRGIFYGKGQSVRPSVRLSVTLMNHAQTVQVIEIYFTPYE